MSYDYDGGGRGQSRGSGGGRFGGRGNFDRRGGQTSGRGGRGPQSSVYDHSRALQVIRDRLTDPDIKIKHDNIEDSEINDGERAPPVDRRGRENKTVPKELAQESIRQLSKLDKWKKGVYSFDGRSILYSVQELYEQQKIGRMIEILDGQRQRTVQVTLSLVSKIKMNSIEEHIQNGGDISQCREALQYIDVCIRNVALKNRGNIFTGRGVYRTDQSNARDLGWGSEIWTGFSSATHVTRKGAKLVIDLSHTGFYKSQPLLSLVRDLLGPEGGDRYGGRGGQNSVDFQYGLSDQQISFLQKQLRDIKVEHMTNLRTHLIKSIIRGNAHQVSFQIDGKKTSVADYYQNTRREVLKYPNLPLINTSSTSTPRYLPIEVLRVKPGQQVLKLSPEQTGIMVKQAAIPPYDRFSMIHQYQTNLNNNSADDLKTLGIKIVQQLTEIRARVLPAPFVEYQQPKCIKPENGTWNVRDVKFFQGSSIKSWACVSFIRDGGQHSTNNCVLDFLCQLQQMAQQSGMEVPNRTPSIVNGFNWSTKDAMQQAWECGLRDFGEPPQIITVVLPTTAADKYKEVKRIGDSELGVVTQCLVEQKAKLRSGRVSQQYIANLLLKINMKAGGTNLKLLGSSKETFPVIGQKPFMIVGISISHPVSRNTTVPSVGGVVGSYDSYGVKYIGRQLRAGHRQTSLSQLSETMNQLLAVFSKKNKGLTPHNIVIFREGVSDEQFNTILRQEYQELQQEIKQSNPECKISFIVAQGGHSTRIKPVTGQQDRSGNVLPGTVIDTDGVDPHLFQFILSSQAGLQGTNRPSRYTVLADEIGMGSDGVQLMTYWLTYLFARCTRTVKVPAPIYYADLVAARAKIMVQGEDEELSDQVSAVSSNQLMEVQKISKRVRNNMYFI